jgi:hypothetical protein
MAMRTAANLNPATEERTVVRALATRRLFGRPAALVALCATSATGLIAQTAADSVGRRRIQLLPALGSAPETGLQFGAAALALWEPAAIHTTRPSTLIATARRTTRSQTQLRMEGEHWSRENARRIAASLQWQEFPLPYFGTGDRTPATARELYTPRGTEGVVSLQQRIRGPLYAIVGVRHLQQRITADSAGVLQAGRITGARGGTTTELSGGLQLDTRDNLFAPRTGQWVQVGYNRSDDRLWSDFRYTTLQLDVRSYHHIGATQVIALQLQGMGVLSGDPPFDALPMVGGSEIMRGYKRGRFRDRVMTAAQAEYRSPVWRRLGVVAFGGAGVVAPTFGGLGSARVLPTYGTGVRFQLDARQRIGARADVGRSVDGTVGLHLGFNQAF